MILVQNRQRPSSGNSLLILLILMGFSLASCGIFSSGSIDKPKERPTKVTPKDTDIENAKVDTIRWKDDRDSKIVIKDDEDIDTPTKKSTYEVAVLFPFNARRNTGWEDKSDVKAKEMINFYGGLKLGLEKLAGQGYNINLNTYDSQSSSRKIDDLIARNELSKMDVIIGPRSKSDVIKMAEYTRKNQITLISPWYKGETTADGNKYFIQSGATLAAHCEAITQHISDEGEIDNILLIGRSRERDRFEFFQSAYKNITGGVNTIPELLVDADENDLADFKLTEYLNTQSKTIVILPYYRNQSFIYTILRKLYNDKGHREVIVYGFSQWKDFDILFPYFEALNVRLSSNGYVDTNKGQVKDFNQKYFDLYHDIPTDDAYKGYDLMLYLGTMLGKYGTPLQFENNVDLRNLLYTNFEITPAFPEGYGLDSHREKIQLFENKYVQILGYIDHAFVPIN